MKSECIFGNGSDLQGNKLTGQIPDEIGNCAALLHLYEPLCLFFYFSMPIFKYSCNSNADQNNCIFKIQGFVR